MLITSNNKPASGIGIPVEIEKLLESEFPNGVYRDVAVNVWTKTNPWAALWIALNYTELENAVKLADALAEMNIPYVDQQLRRIARAAANVAGQSLRKVWELRDQVASLNKSIDSLEAGIENAETPAIELALTQALLTQQIERDALKAAIDVHVRAVHDMAVTTAIHGTVNHQAELYVIAQEENCAL